MQNIQEPDTIRNEFMDNGLLDENKQSSIDARNILKKARESARYTQQELANAVHCRRETIANLEKGKYNPSLDMVHRILKAINDRTSVDFYIEDIFPNPYDN